MAFSAINKAPGVYIDEIQVPGPIAGVGTSTAAFVGPAEKGPPREPRFLTSATQFENVFGGFISDPVVVYVTHAVHSFFANGGTACYFVRVGNAAKSERTVPDQNDRVTLVVRAKKEGKDGDKIKVLVTAASIVPEVKAKHEQVPVTKAGPGYTDIAPNQAVVATADAKKFFPGDIVLLEEAGGDPERVTITRVSGDRITYGRNLARKYTGAAKMRIADLQPGQRRIRLESTAGIEAGTYFEIKQAGGNEEKGVVQSVAPASNSITLDKGLQKAYAMGVAASVPKLKSLEFTLEVTEPVQEKFLNLSMDPRHSHYFADFISSQVVDVALPEEPNPSVPPSNHPKADTGVQPLAGGNDENLATISSTDYQKAIDLLDRVDEVNILCVPDSVGRQKKVNQDIKPDDEFAKEVQGAMIDHCERMQDRFTVLDPLPAPKKGESDDPVTRIVTQRENLVSDRGFGALYYPWIYVKNPVAAGRILVPPSGHIAGVYARTDNDRGVHKAPANTTIRGVLGLERTLSDGEQGPLNEQGINVIRSFPGRGIRVWGARTIAPRDITQWRFVNVRRLLLFIEESIQEGTQFAVFEPNELGLWKKLERQVTDFLTRVWQDGGLFGATAEEAFRVRIDEELNPPDLRALGILTVEVIVVPTTPAEFVVFRIISDPTGSVLEEG